MRARVKAWAQTERGRELSRINGLKYAQSAHGKMKKREYANKPSTRVRARARQRAFNRTLAGRFRTFNAHLLRRYGIDAEDWARLFNAQGCACAVCETPLKSNKRTHLDHCHKSGKVRGILCGHCNSVVGFSKDQPEILERAARYVRLHAES